MHERDKMNLAGEVNIPDSLRKERLANLAVEGGPTREKVWAELGLEEKVERLRQVCAGLQHHIGWVGRTVSRLDERFHHHEHGRLGQPVIPANRHDGGIEGSAQMCDPLA